jgi:hypothetical protein
MRPGAEAEQEQLIESIATVLKDSPKISAVLRFLFERRSARQGTTRRQIAIDLGDETLNTNAVGVAVSDLREKLTAYAKSEVGRSTKWICTLPPGDGHRLQFSLNPRRILSPTECFWLPHTETATPITIVSDDLLFFFNLKDASAIRFFNTNVEDIDQALDKLKELHPTVDTQNLRPAYGYEGAGQRVAVERIATWFREVAEKTPHTTTSRNTTRKEVLDRSPILIGHSRTNPFIRRLMDAKECSHLGYRCAHEEFGVVEVRTPRKPLPRERKTLSRFKPEARRRRKIAALRGTKDDVWFGTVTRIPHPGRPNEALTIIASDVEFALREIGIALTDDVTLAQVLKQADVEVPLDDSFEMLFAVKLAPGNMLDEAGSAELLCCRTYAD